MMLKKISFFIFVISLCSIRMASQDWIHYYGLGTGMSGHYIVEYYDKGYIIAGIRNIKNGWIIKTDINGNQLWDILIGNGIYECDITSIEQTKDFGLIVSGSVTKYDQPFDDPFIIKLNNCGNLEWCKVLHFPGDNDYGQNVKCTADGGYILLTFNYTSNPNEKIHLFKFDETGELVWQKKHIRDTLAFDEGIRKLYIDNEKFLISGYCYYPNPGEPGGWIRPYYIQTDTSGNEDWELVYSWNTGFGYVGEAWTTVRGLNNTYYSAGRRSGSPEFLKFSTSGNEVNNVDLFPGAVGGNATTITLLNDTTFILYASWTYNGTTAYMGFIKTDTSGNIEKIKNLPDPDYSGIWWTTKALDNKILGVGTNALGSNTRIVVFKVNSDLEYDTIYTHPFTYDSLCPDSIVSKTIDPDCDFAVDVEEPFQNPETAQLRVYPNPADENVTVELPKYLQVNNGIAHFQASTIYHQWKSTILDVYDLSGKQVFTREIFFDTKTINLTVSGWDKGLFYFRLIYNGKVVAGTKVMID